MIAAVTLVYMGVNAYSTGYGLLFGDNVTSDTNVMKEFITYGIICIVLNFIECMGLFVIVCFEMKKRILIISIWVICVFFFESFSRPSAVCEVTV